METTQIKYEKDQVWLFDWNFIGAIEKRTIFEITGRYIRDERGWHEVSSWQSMVVARYGTVRRILGIPCGVKRI